MPKLSRLDASARDCYRLGATHLEIARAYRMSPEAVIRWLRKQGLPVTTRASGPKRKR